MIYSPPATEFNAVLTGAPTGLVGTLTVQIENPDGTTHTAASTSSIIEAEPGVYVATRTAPLAANDPGKPYLIVWKNPDEDPDVVVAEELAVSLTHPASSADPLSVTWRPSVLEVAAFLRTRTKYMGNEVGTFTADTRPTADQVETIISLATGVVSSRVGSTEDLCTEALTSRARQMATLYAAMIIELSYFPEQVRNEQSPYREYKALYDEGTESLTDAVARECGGGEGEGDPDALGGLRPSYDFSQTVTPLGKEFSW